MNDHIIELLKDGWTSPADAFRELGTMKLTTRVSEIRRAGVPVDSRKVTTKNRFGRTIYYNEYRIQEESK